ncbi:GpE family phage tail protein [Methylophilus sp. 3sh_L]
MADIATIFHWHADYMDALYVEELMDWRERARVRSQVDG